MAGESGSILRGSDIVKPTGGPIYFDFMPVNSYFEGATIGLKCLQHGAFASVSSIASSVTSNFENLGVCHIDVEVQP
jgi:hypothetical protein